MAAAAEDPDTMNVEEDDMKHDFGNAVELFMDPLVKPLLIELSHKIIETSSSQPRNVHTTSCRWFQWFYAAILVAKRQGFTLPPRTRQDRDLIYTALKYEYHMTINNRSHSLRNYILYSMIDPEVCVPYDPSRNPNASYEALCIVKKGPMGTYLSHYFSRIHTPDRGDWILSAYGSCYIASPGRLLPLDPATWNAFVEALHTQPTNFHHPVIRSFFITYFLSESLETVYNDDTENESLRGQPILNREEQELRFLYNPDTMATDTFHLYHIPYFEEYIHLPTPHELRKKYGGNRRHKKQVTRRRKSRQACTRRKR